MMASPARAATFVYVGNAESNDIYVLELDRQRSDLTVVEKVSIPGIEKPGSSMPMALSPDRHFLYVGTRGEPKVAAGFAIDPTTARVRRPQRRRTSSDRLRRRLDLELPLDVPRLVHRTHT